ncbi:hypothetical protein [Flagellimonas okinawensis]|uniref:Uncharacterized protein n=1 Tax=Flagellimonas okinawensis TaxID=3031324 RepID=A0ABT5XN67_9FLAO|nr:hypothetical protein [[Muricauda] okinawensis]MDF0707340.1 hypothetical protein [[Muricauda] okinawensis]
MYGQTGRSQTAEVQYRLDTFISENCTTDYTQISAASVEKVLKYSVYRIRQEIKNIYGEKKVKLNEFIVIDNGKKASCFEAIRTNKQLPELTSYIKENFALNPENAAIFQSMLDYIYPIADWKPDKREYFFKNGKWYFLRDKHFRSRQGFEVTVDSHGKIKNICYKMKWDEEDSK